MKNKKNVKKSTPLSFRLPNDLIEDIDFLRESMGLDRGTFIKNSLSCFVAQSMDSYKNEAIKDFIHLRIDEDGLKEALEEKKDYAIPKDIQEARAQKLKVIIKGAG